MAERICPACKAVVPPRLKFCRECGGRVEDAAESAAAPENPGDATMVGSVPRKPVASALTPIPENAGDATVIGAFTARPPEKEPPTMAPAAEREPPTMALPAASTGEETILGAMPTAAPKPARAPAEEPEPEPEPVTDDFDEEVADGGPTLAQAALPAVVPVPVTPSPAAPPAAPLAAGEIRLEHWSPRVKTAAVVLSKEETVVGRDRGDLQYPEDSCLSKKHARFFRDPEGRLCVEDLGALNGTYLRLRVPVKLEHRDILFLGRHSFRFELLQHEDKDDRTIEGDPLTRVQGVQGKAPRSRLVKRQEEGFRGLPFYFGTQRYVLGRTDGTHNFQKDDQMSRRHAALQYKDGDYWLEDLGSQNGTFLRLRGPRPLEPGDVVKMGDQYFKLP